MTFPTSAVRCLPVRRIACVRQIAKPSSSARKLGVQRDQACLLGRFFAGRPTVRATFFETRFLVDFFAAFTFRARAARAFTRFWASFARASADSGRRFLA